jgi:hypothetical protein
VHVYPSAQQGWHCFSCRRGGSIYDLASQLWDIPARGSAFLQLRDMLTQELLARASCPASSRIGSCSPPTARALRARLQRRPGAGAVEPRLRRLAARAAARKA